MKPRILACGKDLVDSTASQYPTYCFHCAASRKEDNRSYHIGLLTKQMVVFHSFWNLKVSSLEILLPHTRQPYWKIERDCTRRSLAGSGNKPRNKGYYFGKSRTQFMSDVYLYFKTLRRIDVSGTNCWEIDRDVSSTQHILKRASYMLS